MTISGISANLDTNDFNILPDGVYINKNITNSKPSILLIHANFCSHCKRFIPTFQKLSATMNKNGPVFPCVAIEQNDISDALGKALNFQGFPTIKFVDQYGKIIGDYNGSREMSSLLTETCNVYHHCIFK